MSRNVTGSVVRTSTGHPRSTPSASFDRWLYFTRLVTGTRYPAPTAMRPRFRAVALSLLALLILGAGVLALRRPSHERAWSPEHAVLPHVTITDSLVHIAHVRNFAYASASDFTPRYEDRTYDLRQIERVWYVLSPFDVDWRGPAHAFLTFGFADGQYVSISVEARREVGEAYSIWKGALRQFELIYVIGDERDLIGVRAAVWDDPVYLYPGRATAAQVREVFLAMLRRAQAIEREPAFYNTFTDNCTTSILDAVNRIAPEPVPYGRRVLLPGYSDALAHEQGLLDTDLSLEEARAAYRINARAKAAITAPNFSAHLRR